MGKGRRPQNTDVLAVLAAGGGRRKAGIWSRRGRELADKRNREPSRAPHDVRLPRRARRRSALAFNLWSNHSCHGGIPR